MGITDMDVFAHIAADAAAFRTFLEEDLFINPGGPHSTHRKVQTSKLISIWSTANVRGTKRRADEADRRW